MTSPNSSTSRPQLVYLVFGAETYHQEAVFSIASAWAKTRDLAERPFDIQVFTDNPEPYRELPVRIRPFDTELRHTWSGPHQYHFRCKHMVARTVLEESDKAILIDTDTFFHHSPMALFERIQPGTLLCNALRLRFVDYKESSLYTVLAKELAQRNLADDQMVLINSGVIGLMRQDIAVLDKSIALMDEYFPRVPGAVIMEEFCLGIAAYRSLSVAECPDLIHHYWSRKQLFRAKVRAWLNKHASDPLSDHALADTVNVSEKLPRPSTFQRLVYKGATLAVPAQQRQFVREVLYGCCDYPNEFDRACSHAWWEKAFSNAEQRMKRRIPQEQLKQWLDHWAVRRLLGRQREAIFQHLVKTQTEH
ncbi:MULTISPECIES: hypothetical protein [unclassified Pseudomonas]|uniref:hypothetical protein n=1 Tax=unclassified Pseudomonas TaxID=196821 RepID=UPI00384C6D5A